MSSRSPFRYQPLGAREIRLLTLHITTRGVSCTLDHYLLESTPSFYALSYVWGTEPFSEQIELDRNPFLVTKHLLAGLLTLGRQYGRKPFWIDAICIDQSNDAEKAVQVPQMAAVYSSAAKVVAWLGPASDNSDLFMAQVPKLNTIFAGITDPESVNGRSWCDHGLPPLEDPIWLAFLNFSFRPWFDRLWVVQEVALAKSAVLVCGEHEVDLEEMMTLAEHLVNVGLSSLPEMIYKHNFQEPEAANAVTTLISMRICQQALQDRHHDFALWALLFISREKQATEPLDKVYGILGLLSKPVRDKVVVDYSAAAKQRFWQAYVPICRVLFEEIGPAALSMAASEQRHPDLPTWCPDLRYRSPVVDVGFEFRAGRTTSTGDMARIPTPGAKMIGPDGVEFCGLMMDHVKHGKELFLRGLANNASEYEPYRAQQVIKCEEDCLELSQQAYGLHKGEAVPYQHMEALVMAKTANWSRYEEAQVTKDYHMWKEWHRIMAAHQRSSDREMEAAAERYNNAARIAWKGRAFFATEGGRVGIGPEDMRPGDSVHVFFDAHAPYILRFDTSKQAYTLVGQAFVAGLMFGEAFWARDPINTFERFLLR